MKKLTTTLGLMVLVGVLAVPVFAWHRGGWGGGSGGPGHWGQRGGSYGNLTTEQRSQLDNLEQTFYEDTRSLRREIWTKSDELDVLLNASDPDLKKVKALQKEISDLRAKMEGHRTDFELGTRKIVPDEDLARGYGRGGGRRMGRHMKGYGPRGGYGPGSCW